MPPNVLTALMCDIPDYPQALEFDQLRGLMKDGRFSGFSEGLVNFPPTFKYDVQYQHRGHRHHLGVRKAIRRTKDQFRKRDARDQDSEEEGDAANDAHDSTNMAEDRQSIASSVVGSSLCSGSINNTSESDFADLGDENAPALLNMIENSKSPSSGPAGTVYHLTHGPMVQKARSTWLALMARARGKSSTSSSRFPKKERGSISSPKSPKATPLLPPNGPRTNVPFETTPSVPPSAFPGTAAARPTAPTSVHAPGLERSGELVDRSRPQTIRNYSSASQPTSSVWERKCSAVVEEIMPGVYDTSSKRRVPSW